MQQEQKEKMKEFKEEKVGKGVKETKSVKTFKAKNGEGKGEASIKISAKIPEKIKDLTWSKQGELYVLLDQETSKTYSLDPIAFLVWIQCDGKTQIDKIVDVFSVNGNRDIVKAAINGILEKLEGNGLIRWI